MSTSRNTLDLWRMDEGDGEGGEFVAIDHAYALCEVLGYYGCESMIPVEIAYERSPLGWMLAVQGSWDCGMWPLTEYAERFDKGVLTADEAARAIRLLTRYINLLRALRPEDPCMEGE